jgi:hypothetical protein
MDPFDDESDQQHEDSDFNFESSNVGVVEKMSVEEKGEKEQEKDEVEHDKEEKKVKEKQEQKKEVALKLMKRKTPKKTKLEKSIEVLSNGFLAAAEKEAETMMMIEGMRQKERMEQEIRLKELDNEWRREERQHELLLLNVLTQNRNQVPTQDVNYGQSTMIYNNHYGTSGQIQPPTSVSDQDGTYSTYYKL